MPPTQYTVNLDVDVFVSWLNGGGDLHDIPDGPNNPVLVSINWVPDAATIAVVLQEQSSLGGGGS